MANATAAEEACPAPLLPASRYPRTGGFLPGRVCVPLPISGNKTVKCCLPCPQTDWVYPDNFFAATRAANYLNVIGLVCCLALLLTFAVLPADKTQRHYMTICLVLAIILMELGFIIPLGAKPKQCYNDITPHDMFSDTTCALSGTSLLVGGWCAVMWVFIRALSLHLQICWEVVTGKKYFIGSQLAGWGVPIVFVAISLATTGVSYRFGDTCHINHAKALQVFWVPMLTCAAAAIVVQFSTFGYCIKVYLQSLMEDQNTRTHESSGLPSFNGSVRTATAAQAYRRVRRVVRLQWRGITIVLLILINVVFFSFVFVYLDVATQRTEQNYERARPWFLCLIMNGGDKNKCLDLAEKVVLKQATVMAVLIMLSMNGFWCMVLLGRRSMLHGWKEWFRKHVMRRREFVSIDARRFSSNPRAYEMLQSPAQVGKAAAGMTRPADRRLLRTPETSQVTPLAPAAALPAGSAAAAAAATTTTTTTTAATTAAASPTGTPLSTATTTTATTTPILPSTALQPPRPALSSPRPRTAESVVSSSGSGKADDSPHDCSNSDGGGYRYYGRAATYNSPQLSFSTPRPPPRSPPRREWDPTATYAPSMTSMFNSGMPHR